MVRVRAGVGRVLVLPGSSIRGADGAHVVLASEELKVPRAITVATIPLDTYARRRIAAGDLVAVDTNPGATP